jgi:hypothetical protein
MISITAPEAVILVGAALAALGLMAPDKVLSWQKLDSPTLTIAGFFILLVGAVIGVVLS